MGPIRRKQWWALLVGILGTVFGLWSMYKSVGDWGPFAVGAVCFVLLGLFPLWLCIRGRSFLAIASEEQAICFPMDRKKKQVRRALALLKGLLPSGQVRWDIDEF